MPLGWQSNVSSWLLPDSPRDVLSGPKGGQERTLMGAGKIRIAVLQ
jgi:hypothetical protein